MLPSPPGARFPQHHDPVYRPCRPSLGFLHQLKAVFCSSLLARVCLSEGDIVTFTAPLIHKSNSSRNAKTPRATLRVQVPFHDSSPLSCPQLLRHDPARPVLPGGRERRASLHLLPGVRQRNHVVRRRAGEARRRTHVLPGQGGRAAPTGSGLES